MCLLCVYMVWTDPAGFYIFYSKLSSGKLPALQVAGMMK